MQTGNCRATWEGHTGSVCGVAITPNGKWVVSGSADKTLKIWNLQTGLCISTLEGHEGTIGGIAITPDGRRAISASYDQTLRIWELPESDVLDEAPPESRYTNAKVVLIGETSAGKTGLAILRTTVSLLAGQGLLQKLAFGDFVLLQPEYINNYSSIVVRCARESTDEMGNIPKAHVLESKLDYKDMKRLDKDDEKILLRAMLQTFMERSLCLEEETGEGTQLVFPSYFKRDRPELPTHPAILITYRFNGPIDEIYSTLVVRLYYTNDFMKDQLWKNAADFKTHSGKQAGILLTKIADDTAELAVYFEPGVPEDTQVSFIKYIHEHLLKRSETVERQRSYICPHCQTPLEAPEAVKKRLGLGFKDIMCQVCEKRFDLIDSIERKFASSESLAKVRAMDEEAKRKLDNESLELILEGQAKAITGEAGHIYRELSHDHGIDAEIEFKNEKGQASGQRVYLQLKSGFLSLQTKRR